MAGRKHTKSTKKKSAVQRELEKTRRELAACKKRDAKKRHTQSGRRKGRKYRSGSFSLIGGSTHQKALIRKQNALEAAARAEREAAAAARKAERAAFEASLGSERRIVLGDASRRRKKGAKKHSKSKKKGKLTAKTKKAMAAGARRYQAFIRARMREGATRRGAQAMWRREKEREAKKGKSKRKSKRKTKRSSRDMSPGQKRYLRFMRRERKTWHTRPEALELYRATKARRKGRKGKGKGRSFW